MTFRTRELVPGYLEAMEEYAVCINWIEFLLR
jgi:hypothetical protein